MAVPLRVSPVNDERTGSTSRQMGTLGLLLEWGNMLTSVLEEARQVLHHRISGAL